MTADPLTLSRSEVRNWTEQRFFERGEGYFNQNRIQHPRREGCTLKAECQGSRPSPYHVEAELDEDGIAWAECSCPMGSGGYCKHVVALLLTWIHSPDDFSHLALEQQLHAFSPDKLVDLIVEMVDRHPDLERLVSLSAQSATPLDEEHFRNQVRSVLEQGPPPYSDDPWQATVDVAEQMGDFLDLADDYRDDGRLGDAVQAYRCIAEEACNHYMDFHDESGTLAARINTCTERLAAALETADDPELRDTILRTLFDVYMCNIRLGGFNIGSPARDALLVHTSADEKQQVAQWVRDAISGADVEPESRVIYLGSSGISSRRNDWKRRTLGGFLLDLEADTLDDERYLDICRRTGRLSDLVDRLLERDRHDEALDAVRDASDDEVVQLTSLFANHDATELLYSHVTNRIDATTDRRLVAWLRDAEREHGSPERALKLSRRLFWEQPSPDTYEPLRPLAQDLDRWDEVQSEIHEQLREQGAHALLTRLHLTDHDVGDALKTVRRTGTSSRYGGATLAMKVAEAAEDEYPDEAIELYRERARTLIADRGRDNYAQAATYMKRVKTLLEREDRHDTWKDRIEQLVDDELHRLPAGRDEFQKADLL